MQQTHTLSHRLSHTQREGTEIETERDGGREIEDGWKESKGEEIERDRVKETDYIRRPMAKDCGVYFPVIWGWGPFTVTVLATCYGYVFQLKDLPDFSFPLLEIQSHPSHPWS